MKFCGLQQGNKLSCNQETAFCVGLKTVLTANNAPRRDVLAALKMRNFMQGTQGSVFNLVKGKILS
jgi:hypothetical protein